MPLAVKKALETRFRDRIPNYDYEDAHREEELYYEFFDTESPSDPPQKEEGSTHSLTLEDAMRDLLDRIDSDKPTVDAVPTGVALLDETSGGLVRGEYIGVIGGPGNGKSTICDAIVLNALRKNPASTGLVFALETAVLVRCARLLAGISVQVHDEGPEKDRIKTYAPLSDILHGRLSPELKSLARESAEPLITEIGSRLSFTDDLYDATEIATRIISDRPDFVILDHLGLVCMDGANGSSALDRFDAALGLVAKAIKEANACAILIAEVSKQAITEGSVDISSVRGSARFASLAGQMLGIKQDGAQQKGMTRLAIQLHKNRHGQSMRQQSAILFGAMGHVHWLETSDIIFEKTETNRRSVHGN